MEYIIHLIILFGIYGILALSLDLIVGFTGLLSLSHAAFYGIGAYAVAVLSTTYGMNFFVAALIGMSVAAVVALMIGFVLRKFKDDYYALASFGFNVIAVSIFLNWESITKGPLGIPGIKRPELFGFVFSTNTLYMILTLALFALTALFVWHITKSSFGRVLRAIREDEKALEVFGYRITRYKLAIYVISGALAALAGALYASYITYVDPSTFTANESIVILSMIILGGLASLRGAIVGAAILIALPEALRFVGLPMDVAAQLRQVIYGLILALLMLYRPKGMYGEYEMK
ncbi:MAG: hypothetical protein ACD_81C00076G0009 [uncultured bacterium]|uniref:Amino acid/amide ABC transporter membrane protein 2, HAAT family n=1 Tax=Candidatus Wolfebacteria bacterium GW2011_GWE2_44_13 TaxID=1619017 RepID=A0A0G1K5T6_9BACT|nr:MAG: hypothetical protein ACD_81C00076G0009 [uncultured bacterium]KKT43179.1 MAG: Amino acid/amide ABC transporter membrane protein 2, HAAT family [Candidatus Wolfebacteria bacterium GW2011_GWE2_44_13]